MKTIETKPGVTLGFREAPKDIKDWSSNYLIGGDGITEKSKVIGKLSEITEEQAKELIDIEDGRIKYVFNGYTFSVRFFDEFHGLDLRPSKEFTSRKALTEIAKCIGIEDFENYLVIKL